MSLMFHIIFHTVPRRSGIWYVMSDESVFVWYFRSALSTMSLQSVSGRTFVNVTGTAMAWGSALPYPLMYSVISPYLCVFCVIYLQCPHITVSRQLSLRCFHKQLVLDNIDTVQSTFKGRSMWLSSISQISFLQFCCT